MILIDVPFPSVRLYLWLAYHENASMFLMKNALSIVLSRRGMYPDLIEFKNDYLVSERKKKRLKPLSIAPESQITFEEISLSDKANRPENV